jgi:hypothetical protein
MQSFMLGKCCTTESCFQPPPPFKSNLVTFQLKPVSPLPKEESPRCQSWPTCLPRPGLLLISHLPYHSACPHTSMPVWPPSSLLVKSLSSVFQETWGPSPSEWNSCVFFVPSTNFNNMLNFYFLFINLSLNKMENFLRTKSEFSFAFLLSSIYYVHNKHYYHCCC